MRKKCLLILITSTIFFLSLNNKTTQLQIVSVIKKIVKLISRYIFFLNPKSRWIRPQLEILLKETFTFKLVPSDTVYVPGLYNCIFPFPIVLHLSDAYRIDWGSLAKSKLGHNSLSGPSNCRKGQNKMYKGNCFHKSTRILDNKRGTTRLP